MRAGLQKYTYSAKQKWVRVHSTDTLVSACMASLKGHWIVAGLAERVGGFEAEAEWSHVLRCDFEKASAILERPTDLWQSSRDSLLASTEIMCSLGEQQRVAFARLLLHRPGLSFLDEATSAVDSETAAVLYRALQHQSKSFVSVGERT